MILPIWRYLERALRMFKPGFKLRGGIVDHTDWVLPEQGIMLSRIIVGLPNLDTKGRQKFLLIACYGDAIEITNHFKWKDGRDIFDKIIAHLRFMLYWGNANDHISALKWSDQLCINFDVKKSCQAIWQPFLSIKEASPDKSSIRFLQPTNGTFREYQILRWTSNAKGANWQLKT